MSNSPLNVMTKLIEFGVENKLLIKKYLNMQALENDTLILLNKVPPESSWDEHQDIVHQLIDMYYPAAGAIVQRGGCEWSHAFDIDLEVQSILISEGYDEIEEQF